MAECGESGCLYNIKEDPYEYMDFWPLNFPISWKEIQTKLAADQATYFHPDRRRLWRGACDFAVHNYSGFWGPFIDV